jgi:hypothetical protein
MTRSPRKFLIAFTVAATIFSIIGETAYRAWLYRTYVVSAKYPVVTMDYPAYAGPFFVKDEVLGPYPPNTHFIMSQYGVDGEYQRSSHISVNNLGWVSPYDYSLSKPPGEFRLAILGDSLTASINNDIPWPSIVQEELRKTLPQTTVMNLGVPGMSTQLMARLTLPIAQRLAADAVIVNMIVENLDFALLSKDDIRRIRTPEQTQVQTLVAGGVTVQFSCPASRNECQLNPTWNVPRGRQLSQSDVTEVKQIAARLALRSRLIWTPKSFLWSGQGVMQSAPTASTEEQIAAAVDALLAIKKAYPNLLVTINPVEWYYNPATIPAKSAKFISEATAAGLDVVEMREHMPQASADERHRWWNMPYDGHWSNYGAPIYGRAMADVIMQRARARFAGRAGATN